MILLQGRTPANARKRSPGTGLAPLLWAAHWEASRCLESRRRLEYDCAVNDHSVHLDRTKAAEPVTCDLPDSDTDAGNAPPARFPSEGEAPSAESRRYAFRSDYRWEGVPTRPYKDVPADWAQAVRCVLIGAGQEATDFHLRYFELAPGGYTSLEKHGHAHVIVAVRGKGIVVAAPHRFDVAPLDTVYIAPEAPHQIINASHEPFGFLCIVDAVRDRPRALSPDDVRRLMDNPALREVIRPAAGHPLPGSSCQPVGDAPGGSDGG